MCPLRRVEDHHAGPTALGILVPPGRRTFLIVRPRALPWDLVLLRPPPPSSPPRTGGDKGGVFHDLGRVEADTAARALYHALAEEPAAVCVEVAGPDGQGFRVRATVGPFALLLCARLPEQPYRPLVSLDAETARAAAEQLSAVLCPPPDVEQEVYLNTRNFAR